MNNQVISPIPWLSPKEAKQKTDAGAMLVDVRTPAEQREGHIAGASLINSEETPERIAEYGNDKEREIVVYCKSGGRSGMVAEFLREQGFKNVYNAGGYEQLVEAFR